MTERTAYANAKLEGWLIANVDATAAEECLEIVGEIIKAEQDRCCQLVFGHCSSDNVAQRTVDAIRGKNR